MEVMISKKQTLLLVIFFQILIVGGIFLQAFHPLLAGEEVQFKILSFTSDEASSRGNINLEYAFNSLDLNILPTDINKAYQYHYGDIFYLSIAPKGEFYEPTGVWRTPPKEEKFMQVIFQDDFDYDTLRILSVKAGIESYFVEKESISKVNNWIPDKETDIIVKVMLASNGKARIKSIELRNAKK